MTGMIGFKSFALVGKEVSYGLGIDADEQIPLVGESINPEWERLVSDVKTGHGGREVSLLGKRKITGSLSTELSYRATDLLLAALMGGGGDTVEDLSGVGEGPWKHTLKLADINRRSLVVHIKKSFIEAAEIWVFNGVKINKMTLKAEASSGEVTVDWEVFARGFLYKNDGGYLPGIKGSRAIFEHVSFQISEMGDTLTPIGIASLELTIDRKLKSDDYTSESYPDPLEPVENDFRDVLLNINIPRFESRQFIDWFWQNKRLQAELIFHRGEKEEIKFIFPTLEIAQRPKVEINSAGIIPIQIQLVARRNYGNTSYADVTEEVQIEIINDRSTPIWG